MKISEEKVPGITPDRQNIYSKEIGSSVALFFRPGYALGAATFPIILCGWRYVNNTPAAIRLTVSNRRTAWELHRIADTASVQDFLRLMFDFTDETFQAYYGQNRRTQLHQFLTQTGCRVDRNSLNTPGIRDLPKWYRGTTLLPKEIPPRAGERWIAVEIEAVFPKAITAEVLLKRFFDAKLWGVCVKNDGSITAKDGQVGHEIVLCRPRMGFEVSLYRLCLVLQQLGAMVNVSCGLHVHFDLRGASEFAVESRAKLLERHLEHAVLMLPPSRRSGSWSDRYCKSGLDWNDRYRRINLQSFRKYQTLEIRVHSGTCDFTKILNWIQLLEVLMHWPLRRAIAFETWLANLPLSDTARDYWKARARQFSGDGEHVVRTLTEGSEPGPQQS